MAEAFVYNMDSLVTKDYLDARFAEQDARLETRLIEQDTRIDSRFAAIDQKFSGIDVHFAEIKGRFMVQDWILGAIAACTVLPTLYSLFNP